MVQCSTYTLYFPSQLGGGGAGPAQSDMFGGGSSMAGLGEIFGLAQPASFVPPQEVWLLAAKNKGMELSGTFSRKNAQVVLELTFTNRAMQALTGFALQFNKNR